tara:strand:- start:359 stop:826 length:468 start_codon:yes stop_codon:yes gene_type:complete
MNFIYFICPENPQLAKYCEGFFNYLTYGYKNWTRDRYLQSSPKKKQGQSRLLMKKNVPQQEEMKAGDPVLDRIYQKVITSDCYEHSYSRITDSDINASEVVLFITSNSSPKLPPSYLYNKTNSVIVWKITNVSMLTENKYQLLESLIRRIAQPKD